MVYIDKKYPSQQGPIKKGLGDSFSVASNITMIIQVICLVIISINAQEFKNQGMESLKLLWINFAAILVVLVLCTALTYVFCYLSKRITTRLIAPTYIFALNGVYILVSIILLLVFMF